MLHCWQEDPTHRPSFVDLKEVMSKFSHGSDSPLIQFPDPGSASDSSPSNSYSVTSPTGNNGCNTLAQVADTANSPLTTPTSIQQSFLAVRTRVRRHASEPNSDLDSAEDAGRSVTRRTHSNPYVKTPKLDSKVQARRSFEWNLEPLDLPIITIQPNEDI